METKKRVVLVLIAFCSAIVYTAQPAWTWETTAVDDGPVLGPSSLAVDGSGHVHIVYRDESSQRLKYAANITGSWVSLFIEPSLVTNHPSIAVDSVDHLHIVCETAEGIKYLSDSSESWTVTDIGPGCYPSIGIDPSGHVHLCYMNGPEVWYETNRSGAWTKERVSTVFFYPWRTSIAVDTQGHAHVRYASYMDFYGDESEYYATNASGCWAETPLPFCPLDLGLVWNPSLTIDSCDHAHICYMSFFHLSDDFAGMSLIHATNATGRMRSRIVSWEGGMFPAWTAMATDNTNSVHISYTYWDADVGDTFRLKYATNANGTWTVSEPLSDQIDESASSIGVDTSGTVYISYTDTGDRLLVTSGKAEEAYGCFITTATR